MSRKDRIARTTDFLVSRRGGDARHGVLALLLVAMVSVFAIAIASAASAAQTPIYGWGEDKFGQIGDGTTSTEKNPPVKGPELSEVTQISAGGQHSLALLKNGEVKAWGSDETGQLGNGKTEKDSVTPVTVVGLKEAVRVAACTYTTQGTGFSMALTKNGSVYTWGDNADGQLGIGSTGGFSDEPKKVEGLESVVSIACSNNEGVALLSNGTVVDWGSGFAGDLGIGSETPSNVPVSVNVKGVTAIAAGGGFVLALLNNGTVKGWGFNLFGELGQGPGEKSNSFVPVTVRNLKGVTAIAAGEQGLALLKNGTVKAWGNDTYGQVGNGVTEYAVYEPVTVQNLEHVTAISAAGFFSLALLQNGEVKAWGEDQFGQLGDGIGGREFTKEEIEKGEPGKIISSAVPVEVKGLTGITAISADGSFALALQ